MAQQAETRVTGWVAFGHYGLTHYRIWQRHDGFVMWQRHEWKREDGTTDLEEWIRSTPSWTRNAQPVADAA